MNGSQPASALPSAEWACLSLPADLGAVEAATQHLRDWLQARGAEDSAELNQTMLAVTEALTNSVRHGAKTGDAHVRLAWAWRQGGLELEVSEPGSFTPTKDWSALPDDLLSEGGRGGFLITQLMDAVQHRNAGGRHALVLRKQLPMRPPESPAAGEAELTAMTEELGNAYETIAALFHFAESLATAPGLEALVERSFARLRPLTGANAAWVRLREADGSLRLLAQSGGRLVAPVLAAESKACEAAVAATGRERTLARRAELAADDPLRAEAGCAFVCPFAFEGRLRGVLTVTRAQDAEGFFTAGQIGLVRTLADFMGIACGSSDLQVQRQQAERAARQLEFAETIQRGLLPQRIGPHPAWLVHGVCSQAAEVGGDFYDVIDLPGGRRLAVIADVMGKGMPAALLAATLRSALRAHAATAADPAELLTLVNRQLGGDLQHLEMFITAQVVELAPAGGRLRYASAGHCPILRLERNQPPEWWQQGGLPLGVDLDEKYEATEVAVRPGACVLLMTDGVLEHEDAAGIQFGREGLLRHFNRCGCGRTEEVGPELLTTLKVRAGGLAPKDDCTLVAISLLPGPTP